MLQFNLEQPSATFIQEEPNRDQLDSLQERLKVLNEFKMRKELANFKI